MYWDERQTEREKWKFHYKGSELLQAALKKRNAARQAETVSREQMAVFMRDRKISMDSDDVKKCKAEIDKSATLAEQCGVYVHEFTRNGDREYTLGIGDVTFFGLVKE